MGEMLVHCCSGKGETYHVVLAGAKPYLHSAGRSGLPRGAGRSQTIPSLCWQTRLTMWCWQEPNHTFTLLAGQAYHVVLAGAKPFLHSAGRSGLPCGAGRSQTIPSLCWQVRLTMWCWQEPHHSFTLLPGQAYHVVLAGAKPYLHSAGRSDLPRGAGRSQTIPPFCWQVRLTMRPVTLYWKEPNHTFMLLAGQAYHVVLAGAKPYLHFADRLGMLAGAEPYLHAAGKSGLPSGAGADRSQTKPHLCWQVTPELDLADTKPFLLLSCM
jgi:hypothetical protein